MRWPANFAFHPLREDGSCQTRPARRKLKRKMRSKSASEVVGEGMKAAAAGVAQHRIQVREALEGFVHHLCELG